VSSIDSYKLAKVGFCPHFHRASWGFVKTLEVSPQKWLAKRHTADTEKKKKHLNFEYLRMLLSPELMIMKFID